MRKINITNQTLAKRVFPLALCTRVLLLALAARAAVPGISGTSFVLSAGPGSITQPDGVNIYSWGYSCAGSSPTFVPFPGTCPSMQVPGPTLVVMQNTAFT